MPEDHDWWTPEHPEDGLKWVDPNVPTPEPGADGRRGRFRRRGRSDTPREPRRPRTSRATGPPKAPRAPGTGRRLRAPAGLRRPTVIRRRFLALGLLAVVVVVVIISQLGGGPAPVLGPPLPGLGHAAAGNPFAYNSADEAAFVKRAASGNAQPLFIKSPGGVMATAKRVAAYRNDIDAAVQGTGIDPNLLEGLVFLESAGDSQIIAGTDPANASGLTQILAGTGESLLGMQINLTQSRRITGQIEAAGGPDAPTATVARLERRRAAIDDRFDPTKALAATVRYLEIARKDFGGRIDLALESYHMGIGNLQHVLADYNGGTPVPYAQVYFDSAPDHNPQTYALLQSFGDDSSTYLWRLYAAVEIMHLYRTDRGALAKLISLETNFSSNALVLVPPAQYHQFSGPSALSAAYQSKELLPLPANAAKLGLAYAPTMGSLAHKLKVPAALYRGLRPAALDLLIELVHRVQVISGSKAPLTVASTVSDARYEALLGLDDPPALTGYTFQLERRYGSRAQRDAMQAMLDQLQSLNLVAWIRGSKTIEITVAPDADQVIAHGI